MLKRETISLPICCHFDRNRTSCSYSNVAHIMHLSDEIVLDIDVCAPADHEDIYVHGRF